MANLKTVLGRTSKNSSKVISGLKNCLSQKFGSLKKKFFISSKNSSSIVRSGQLSRYFSVVRSFHWDHWLLNNDTETYCYKRSDNSLGLLLTGYYNISYPISLNLCSFMWLGYFYSLLPMLATLLSSSQSTLCPDVHAIPPA